MNYVVGTDVVGTTLLELTLWELRCGNSVVKETVEDIREAFARRAFVALQH